MKTPPSPQRTVSWNGLTLPVPQDWDAIIRDKRSLIFERDLHPVVELRWEPGMAKLSIDKQRERILGRLKSESRQPLSVAETGGELAVSAQRFETRLFGSSTAEHYHGVLLICTHCRTMILARLHAAWFSDINSFPLLFEELICQHQGEDHAEWAIQDVTFRIPPGFSLDRFGISFGMSTFSFSDKTTSLDLCRLAPASEHLKDSALDGLFQIFSRVASADQQALDKNTLWTAEHPSFVRGLLDRLRRRRPFKAAYFHHLPDFDRILGFRLQSSRPLSSQTIQTIQDNYGLIQKES